MIVMVTSSKPRSWDSNRDIWKEITQIRLPNTTSAAVRACQTSHDTIISYGARNKALSRTIRLFWLCDCVVNIYRYTVYTLCMLSQKKKHLKCKCHCLEVASLCSGPKGAMLASTMLRLAAKGTRWHPLAPIISSESVWWAQCNHQPVGGVSCNLSICNFFKIFHFIYTPWTSIADSFESMIPRATRSWWWIYWYLL